MTAVSPHIDTGQNVLTVSNLSLEFSNSAGVVRALDDVSFAVRKGEILSLVGESGCGKSGDRHVHHGAAAKAWCPHCLGVCAAGRAGTAGRQRADHAAGPR